MTRRKRDPENPLVMKNFMAPAKLLAQLQELSEREGVSESEIIRTAVEQYVTDALNPV
jgi:predicted DNA-binding protein